MPRAKFVPTKKDDGSYATSGLTLKQFEQQFNRIQKEQKKNREKAKRTLRPSVMNNPTPKALKALGEKAKGQRFTKKDLEDFDQARQRHQEKYDSTTAGITYAFLIKNSLEIDVKRANNQVSDGRGINKATLVGIKGNTVSVNVKASSVSKHENHRVKIRMEQWEELLVSPPDRNYDKAAQLACAGRISFDCDCGRHQFWYRYLGTMGKYQITPPSEFSFPKIKNPELVGVACKHVIRATTMLQSKAWHRILATQMKAQAKRVGYGQTRNYTLSKEEQKQAAKNRKVKADKGQAEKAYRQYVRAQKAMELKIKQSAKEADITKRQAKKIRKQDQAIQRKDQEIKELRQVADMMKMGFSNFNDGYKLQGKSRSEALTDYAKMMNVSETKLKRIIK